MTDPVKIIVGEGDITEVNVPEYGIIQTGGGGGSDGATFFPEVSQEGVISWTNDGGYDNPEPVNIKGPAGNDGNDGQNGVTFTPSVSDAGIISWTNDGDLPNPSPVNIKGSDGEDGADGVSPAVTFGTISGGHTMTVTDKTHPTGQTINIMDGTQGDKGDTGPGVPAGGTTGQVLAKKSNADNDTEWINQSGGGGGGGTSDYDDLTDKPSINNVTLSGNKTAAELSLGTYSKPSGGIPQTDLAQTVQNKLDSTVVVSDTQPTATENKLWVDTDAGAGASYQIPTVAEMDAADNTILGNLAMIESSPATAAHAVGEYIVYNGRLYEVTAAITSGQSLVVGTNIKSTTATDLIADAKQQLLPAGTLGLQAYGYITSGGRRLSVSCPAASFHSETVQIIDAIDSLTMNLRTFFFANNTLAGGYVKSANFDATPYISNATVGSGGRGLYFALLMPEGETWGTLNNIPVAGDMSITLNRDV